jgi:hypothetical protein
MAPLPLDYDDLKPTLPPAGNWINGKWTQKFRKSDKNSGIPSNEIAMDVQKLCVDSKAWLEFKPYPRPMNLPQGSTTDLSSFIRLPMETAGKQGS